MAEEIFNPSDPKYRCCCGCHVTTGTKIICYMSFFICLLSGIFGGVGNPQYVVPAIVWLAIISFVCLSPIYGIHKQQPGWLIPYLVLSAIGSIFIGLSLISLTVALIPNTTVGERLRLSARERLSYEDKSDGDFTYPLLFLFFQNLISLGLSIWYFMIVYRCYQYLVERKNVYLAQTMYSPTAVLVTK
uniref:Uncharacterized protein n=1 Tax=Panagrolaimus superbus TaxID=310955 RepID=A0A914YHQ5_9BILA